MVKPQHIAGFGQIIKIIANRKEWSSRNINGFYPFLADIIANRKEWSSRNKITVDGELKEIIANRKEWSSRNSKSAIYV